MVPGGEEPPVAVYLREEAGGGASPVCPLRSAGVPASGAGGSLPGVGGEGGRGRGTGQEEGWPGSPPPPPSPPSGAARGAVVPRTRLSSGRVGAAC